MGLLGRMLGLDLETQRAKLFMSTLKRGIDDPTLIDLVLEGINVNYRDDEGSTPLHMAAAAGENGLVWQLIKFGADPNAKGNDGTTPLHLASHMNRLQVVQSLVEHGVELNPRLLNLKVTPLGAAKMEGNKEIVELLERHGAIE